MHVLVTGGTGFLGRSVAWMLLARGDTVWLMGRNFTEAQGLVAAGAIPLTVDLRDPAAVMAACAGKEIVYHIGAKSEPWGKRADFFAINVGGAEAVIAGCRQHGVRRLVYVSSPSAVFDGHDQLNATEAAPYPRRFASVYSLTKKLGEDRVNATRDRLQTVIVRPKAIFGPGDRALLPRLIAAARAGRLPQIGDGRNRVDLTYVENVAHALILAGSAEAAVGHTYTITNAAHPLLWEVIGQALTQLRLPTRLRRIPLGAALAVAGALEGIAAVTGREPTLTRYSATILARTQTYDISAAKRDLNYAPIVSLSDGIARTFATLEG